MKCEAGYDLHWDDPCAHCGAGPDDRCREAVKRETEIAIARKREADASQKAQAELEKKMMRDDRRTHGEVIFR